MYQCLAFFIIPKKHDHNDAVKISQKLFRAQPDCNSKLLQIMALNSSSAMKELVISLTFP
jgi:hypothetical protein